MKKMMLALFTSLSATGAFAQETKIASKSEVLVMPSHEVGGGASGGFKFSKNYSDVSAHAYYYKFLTPEWELGGRISTGLSRGGGSTFSYFNFLVGGRFNILNSNQDVANAPFVGAYVGTPLGTDVLSSVDIRVEAGKRFALTSSVSYAPKIQYSRNFYSNGSAGSFSVTLFDFTLLF